LQKFRDLLEQRNVKREPDDDRNSAPEVDGVASQSSGTPVYAQDIVEDKSEDDQYNEIRAALDDIESPPRRLTDVVESAGTCFLCGKIWSTFVKWSAERFGSPNRVELSSSKVEVTGLWPKRLPKVDGSSDVYTGYTDDGIHGRLCLIETDDVEGMSWVALSYVWGTMPFRTLTADTLEELKKDGALEAL
jgi:hypothetical protein